MGSQRSAQCFFVGIVIVVADVPPMGDLISDCTLSGNNACWAKKSMALSRP
jgi:hypothetical protein